MIVMLFSLQAVINQMPENYRQRFNCIHTLTNEKTKTKLMPAVYTDNNLLSVLNITTLYLCMGECAVGKWNGTLPHSTGTGF